MKKKRAKKKAAQKAKPLLWLTRDLAGIAWYAIWKGAVPPKRNLDYRCWQERRGCRFIELFCPKQLHSVAPKSWRLKPGGGPLIVTLGEAVTL